MKTFATEVLTLLDEGRTRIRGMIRVDLGSGTYGFIKAQEPFSYNGLTYQPGGLLKISNIAGGSGMVAQKFTIILSASPDDGLTPDVLQTIEQEDYRDRPVRIYDAHFHPDTNGLLMVKTMGRGYIDTIDHLDDPKTGYTLSISCADRALDYTRTNGRKRSNADQQRRSPGDKFLDHASTRGREKVYWGQQKGN